MKVIVMRGVSGSGKSTWIKHNYPEATICSADHYFENNGEYDFDPALLGEAHAYCLRLFADLVSHPTSSVVVVDNTNTTIAEIAPYCALALAYGCSLEIVTVECDLETAVIRNTHNVSSRTIYAQAARLSKSRKEFPPYWKHSYATELECQF